MKKNDSLIRTIIVDDEKPARDLIYNYISMYCQSVEIVAQCPSSTTAYKAIQKYKPHLVFLDIEMPRKSGFELLKMFKVIDFYIIFITAYSSHAPMAFRVSAIDFLLKPLKISELNEAINKVKERLAQKISLDVLTMLDKLEAEYGIVKKLVIPNSKGFSAVNYTDIILCEADGYCTTFYLKGNLKITSSRHLKFYSELLPASQFIRVHNSFIVNMSHVLGYSLQGDIQLTDGNSCALGSTHKREFLNAFGRKK
jgi:two-component system, LytTR family, response regulator